MRYLRHTAVWLAFVLALCSAVGVKAKDSTDSKPALKKITVTESNNLFFTDRYKYLYLPKGPSDPDMKKLRAMVSKDVPLKGVTDPDIFMMLMEWTCMRWEHDPLHEPPPGASTLEILTRASKGEKFRCQEYAQVFVDVLTSFGYVARLLQMRKPDAAYGAPGAGHVAVEVFSNTLSKWVFVDPQWCMMPYNGDTPLNFYELYQLKKNTALDSLRFKLSMRVMARDSVFDVNQYDAAYRGFLFQYFGYEGIIATRYGSPVFLFLQLDGKEQYCTFQGIPVNRRVFTDKVQNLYFNVNTSVLLFDYGRDVNWGELFRTYNIKSPDDYMANMANFAPSPKFSVQLQNNALWFDHYEYSIDNTAWRRVKGDKLDWNLKEGDNDIELRAVNVVGVSGPTNHMHIRFGPDPQ